MGPPGPWWGPTLILDHLIHYMCFKNDLDMCAVRVVIPHLHGYLYPGYESVIRKEFIEELSTYQSKTKHYPAAI